MAYQPTIGKKPTFGRAPPKQAQLLLPCGACEGCRKSTALGWTLRCQLELTQHTRAAFITLTFDEKYVPPTLRKRDYSQFVRRIQDRLSRQKPVRTLRHFGCGEYGEQRQRPHYHIIGFGLDDRDATLIARTWNKGRTETTNVTPQAIAYVAGYVQKKYQDIYSQHERGEQVDPHGEVYTYQPPFRLMSRRPGIGAHARQYTASWRDYAIYDGIKIPVPRFYHKAWKDQATLDQIEQLHREKAERMKDRELPDLHAQALINIAKREIAAAKRRL